MPISHKNPVTILKNFRDNTTTRTGINLFTRDSKARALSDTLSDELISLREEQIAAYYADKISSASGKALDEIGDKLGLPRMRALHAKVDFTEHSLAFYVESGNFGTINAAASIPLPSTVTISSDPNSNELGTSVDYQLSQPYTLVNTEAIQYVTARAINIGSASNVGVGVLRRHSFTSYVDVANNTLKVVNFYPILNGIDDEPDDLYKFRLANHYNRLIQNNETRMKLTALEIPGVVNTKVEPAYFGIGTAGVFALGPENQTNTRLLTGLQQRLDNWRTPGGQCVATAATEVKFDFELEINPNKPMTSVQVSRLKAELNKGFLAYFRSLTIGGSVDLSVLANTVQRRIMTTAAFTKHSDRTFKKVYVRKGFAGATPDEKSRVLDSVYTLRPDEFASLGLLSVEVK